MDSGKRKTGKYSFKDPKIEELMSLIHEIESSIDFQKKYGSIVPLMNLKMKEGILSTLVKFYNPLHYCFTFSDYHLYNSTNKKLKSYGYTEEMPLLLQTRLLEIMDLVKKSTSVDQLMNLMKQEFPQRVSEFQLVESYINGLVNMDDKSTVRDYTKQVYAQIDASSLDVSAVSRLKTMIAIAENSKFLWVETK